eukprot:CAMPEP_0172182452 /NCGR_PEP_ID=MMETSP1050-20130122/18409_1 /TAXON_ID=233186 /ORGANISM="Cryptomonas curvata, Strain CCAP979/52" /LENGTH=518 /DNA_ID=CAMNT_0012855903 /DNA_START=121 /DNA_END=1673 /DNA_ORIENTATION=-
MALQDIMGQSIGKEQRKSHHGPTNSRKEVAPTIELKQYSSNSGFCQGQPNHSIRDAATLWKIQRKRDSDLESKVIGDIFDNHRRWAGVHFDPCVHLGFMEEVFAPLAAEAHSLFANHPSWMFAKQDAKVLHSVVRQLRPKEILEIGSGHSTIVGTAAALRNAEEGHPPTRYRIIEPFPSRVPADLKGLCRPDCIIEKFLENVSTGLVTGSLDTGDVLFIDSSHLVGRHYDGVIGSVILARDVAIEFTEVIPRLRPGVLIHVHDVPFFNHLWFGPTARKDTQGKVHEQGPRSYMEQFMVQALLQYSDFVEPLWFGGAMDLSWAELDGIPAGERERFRERTLEVFGGGLDTRDIVASPFCGGGSVWLRRTGKGLWEGEDPLAGRMANLTLEEVFDKHRTWLGVDRDPLEELPAIPRDVSLACAALGLGRPNATMLDFRRGAVDGAEAARLTKCARGRRREVVENVRDLQLSAVTALVSGDVMVYHRDRAEAVGLFVTAQEPGRDGFVVWVTEVLPRVAPG